MPRIVRKPDSSSAIIPAPESFEGDFSEFFERWIEPNLPSPAAVAEFDRLTRDYLDGPDPLHILRKMPRQERGTICVTKPGARILPADNSPGWWLHERLLSRTGLPDDAAMLFDGIPTHFFRIAGLSTLNTAGFHLAHILDVNDRNTRWEDWNREEVAKRMLRNLHPCNWFLLAKPDWRIAGLNPEIIAWVQHAYAKRYGATFSEFRHRVGVPLTSSAAPPDPIYNYPSRPKSETRRSTRGKPAGNPWKLNRPAISRDLLGEDIRLLIRLGGRCYDVPHDALVEWVGENANALNTESWRIRGYYTWPKPSARMRSFPGAFEIRCPPE